MIGIPTMYWATLVAVIISFFLLWKVWVLTKLLQDKDTQIQFQTQIAECDKSIIRHSQDVICGQARLIKALEANVLSLREIKERREHV